jgi:hypothetical protein
VTEASLKGSAASQIQAMGSMGYVDLMWPGLAVCCLLKTI